MFCVFGRLALPRIASARRYNKNTKRMIHTLDVIHALDGSISSFFLTANFI